MCTPFGAVALSAAWSHSGLPRSAPVLSPCLGGRKVLMAAAIPDSLSICCWWHASFTFTSPSLTMMAEVPCFFQFLPPNPHLMDAIFHHMVVNDLCCLRCDSLHSNWSQLNYGIVLQLNDSTWTFSCIRHCAYVISVWWHKHSKGLWSLTNLTASQNKRDRDVLLEKVK